MFDTVYKIVDAVSDAKLYNCTKIYRDLGKLKKIVNNFKFDDSKIITIKDYSAKYTNKSRLILGALSILSKSQSSSFFSASSSAFLRLSYCF